MNYEFFIARRYFRGRREDSRFLSFIKVMAIVGIAVGSAGLLIALSIVHGFKSVIHEKVLEFAPPISVHSAVPDPLFRADTLQTWLSDIGEIEEVQQTVITEVMLQSERDISGAAFKGVKPGGDITEIHRYISEGDDSLEDNEQGLPGIVLGSALANSIGANIGSTVTVYTVDGIPSPFNSPEIIQFHLSGIYHTGIDRFDDSFALGDIHHVRRLARLGPLQATGLDIRISDADLIEPVHAEIERQLHFPYTVETIYQRYRNIFAWVDLQEQTIPFVISVMVIIAAFNLVGTVLMMVLERIRDIGILKTMGAANREIRRIFLLEGLFVAAIGLGIGIAIAVLFNWLQGTWQIIPLAEENYYMSYAPVEPHLLDFLIVTAVTLVLSSIASWLPARFAAKTDPVRVLTFGK